MIILLRRLLPVLIAVLLTACGGGGGGGFTSAGNTTNGPTTITSLEMSLGADSVVADGKSMVAVRALVKDADNGAAERTTVIFTTTTGTLSALSAQTDNAGLAEVFLIVPTQLGSAILTASVSGFNATKTLTFMAGSPQKVELNAAPLTVHPRGASTLQVTVLDENDNPVANEEVSFNIITNHSNANLNELSVITDVNGQAQITYSAGPTNGMDTVGVRLNNGIRGEVTVEVNTVATVVESMTMTTGAEKVMADGVSAVAIRALVTNTEGNAAASLKVNFATTAGTLSAPLAKTDNNGVAEVILTAPIRVGSATITASVSGFNRTKMVEFTAGPPHEVVLTAMPSTINPQGISTLQATVLDTNGNPVAGEMVSFSLTTNQTNGRLNTATKVTDTNGLASVTYTAGTTNGTDIVRAYLANGIGKSVNIVVSAVATVVGLLELTAGADEVVADGKSIVAIRATVTDAASNAVVGMRVSFATTAGTLQGTTDITDSNGIAEVNLLTPLQVGNAMLTASVSGFSKTIKVKFTAGPPSNVVFNATPTTINPQGISTLKAAVRDTNGNPVAGEMVSFSIIANQTNGNLSAAAQETDVNGQATVTYTAGTANGMDTIHARLVNGSNATVQVIVSAAAAVVEVVELTAGADTIAADGRSTVAIRAAVTDPAGNAVAGMKVSFTTTVGSITSAAQTDSNGLAQVMLTAPTKMGSATLTANANGVIATTTVTFTAGKPTQVLLKTATPTVNPKGTSTIQATVLDEHGNPVTEQRVNFTIDGNNAIGSLSGAAVMTDINGWATVIYTAGNSAGTDTIRAGLANGTEQIINIKIASTGITQKLSLATTQISVKSDNSDSATITATALDNNNVVVPGVTINFNASTGQLSAGSKTTDENGKATVTFAAGNDANNITPALITATVVDSTVTKDIPIVISGTTITINTVSSNLEVNKPITLTVTIKNAAGSGIFDANIVLAVTGTGSASFDKVSGTSDINGQFVVQLTPTSKGTITVTANGSGTTATIKLTVSALGGAFQITEPLREIISPQGDSRPPTRATGEDIIVKVNVADAQNVTFVTSLGTWVENDLNLFTVPANNGIAMATLHSTQSGTASVRAFDTDNPAKFDVTTILLAASANRAHHIVLQSNISTMQPSVGGAIRPAELTATVYTDTDEPVAGAPVVFSLANTTSSNEMLTPIHGVTDSSGQIKAIFTSGTLSSGSSGVSITATVYNALAESVATDTIQINVNQTAGSVVIGASTKLSEENDFTSYKNPLTVMVTDSSGSAVPNAQVSLTAWPTYYATGVWVSDASGKNCLPDITGRFVNEDINENLINDPGEDFNLDGNLTPVISAAGTIPSTVTTDENGVANFSIIYLKKYAVWITTRIRAKTLVLGSETVGELLLDPLMAIISDTENCFVFDSPFGN